MNRGRRITAILWVGAALLSGFALIPREAEVGLMSLKDSNFEEARKAYEGRMKAGDLSPEVISALERIYLEYGDIDRATASLEKYILLDPKSLEARRKLGVVYMQTHRMDKQIANAEALATLDPTQDGMRELVRIYDLFGQHENQIRALQRLAGHGWAKADDYLLLSQLQASRGKLADSAETMIVWRKAGGKSFEKGHAELTARMLLESGQRDRAAAELASWLESNPDLDAAGSFAQMLGAYGQPAQAWKLLEPFEKRCGESEKLLSEVVATERALGRDQQAFERLTRYRKDLPPLLWVPYVDLALARRDLDAAAWMLEPEKLEKMPGWILVSFADAAWGARRIDLLDRVTKLRGSNSEWLSARPLLGVEMALSRGDSGEARRWAEAAEKTSLPPRERIALAGQWEKLGEPARALAQLEKVEPASLDGAGKMQLARLYLGGKRSAEGLARLGGGDGSGREGGAAWALLAIAEGKTEAALGWLTANPVGVPMLAEFYYTAADRKHVAAQWEIARMMKAAAGGNASPWDARKVESIYGPALMAAAAAKLPVGAELDEYARPILASRATAAGERESLVQALLAARVWKTALPEVEKLARTKGGNWFFAFVEAARASEERALLERFLEREMTRKDLKTGDLEQRMYVMLETAPLDRSLSGLRRMAEREPGVGEWTSAYESALDALGHRDELMAIWKRRALAAGTSDEDRRAVGFRLLAAGDRATAEKVLLRLADQAPASSPDVRQLLYLWGPRPPKAALDWMERRARDASAPDAAAWLEALVYAGAPDRAVRAGAKLPAPRPEVYLRALQSTRDLTSLAVALDREVAAQTSAGDAAAGGIDRIRLAGRIALEESLWDPAERAWQQVLRRAPGDVEALSWLARITFAAGRAEPALQYFAQWRRQPAGDRPEMHLLHGQLLDRQGKKAEARAEYRAGLEAAAANPNPERAANIVAAQLRHRLADPGARAEFERLLKEKPADSALRAELAAMLVEKSKYGEAEAVLDAAPSETGTADAPLEIVADWGKPLAVKTEASGRELVIRAAAPLPAGAEKQFSNLPPGWIAGAAVGYDTILLAAARDVEWTAKPGKGQILRIEMRAARDPETPARAAAVRTELLRAQIDAGRGHLAKAAKRYEALSNSGNGATAPESTSVDPAIVLGMALVEQQTGRWRRAERLLAPLALSREPGSEEARRQRDSLWRNERDQVQIDTERRSTGGLWSLDTARVAGHAVLSPALRFGYRVEAGRAVVNGYHDIEGRDGAFTGARRRGEIYLQGDLMGGSSWRASLFGSDKQAGAGFAWERPGASGSTRATAEYGRPFWEFAEGLAQGGTRDRVELMRRQRIGRATAWVAAAASRYGLRDLPGAVSARGVSGGLSFGLGSLRPAGAQGRDQWIAEYGFDTEHRTSIVRRQRASGGSFAPLPFVSREIHTVGAATVQPFGRHWRVEAGAGMMADRLGGNGPYVSGRAIYDAPGGISFQMYYDRRINNLYSAAGAATQAGVSVTYRFGAQGK